MAVCLVVQRSVILSSGLVRMGNMPFEYNIVSLATNSREVAPQTCIFCSSYLVRRPFITEHSLLLVEVLWARQSSRHILLLSRRFVVIVKFSKSFRLSRSISRLSMFVILPGATNRITVISAPGGFSTLVTNQPPASHQPTHNAHPLIPSHRRLLHKALEE